MTLHLCCRFLPLPYSSRKCCRNQGHLPVSNSMSLRPQGEQLLIMEGPALTKGFRANLSFGLAPLQQSLQMNSHLHARDFADFGLPPTLALWPNHQNVDHALEVLHVNLHLHCVIFNLAQKRRAEHACLSGLLANCHISLKHHCLCFFCVCYLVLSRVRLPPNASKCQQIVFWSPGLVMDREENLPHLPGHSLQYGGI